MNKIHHDKVTSILDKLDIETVAKATKFRIRKPRKITAYYFLLSYFLMLGDKRFGLRKWASKITELTGEVTSFQSLAKKLGYRGLDFARAIFAKSVEQMFIDEHKKKNEVTNKLLLKFNRVLLEDSSCVKLGKLLYSYFSGSKNQNAKTAICRIQFCYDIKSNKTESIELNTYSENDLTYSKKIIERLVPNDLVIRDLGYFITSIFKGIIKQKAYFISRLHLGVSLFDTVKEEEFDLVKHLKKLDRLGIRTFDQRLKISIKEKLEVRVLALKLTEQQTAKRRRHAVKSRHKDSRISKKTMYLLTWNIFITNVDDKVLTIKEVYRLYVLRWQIELVFKNWKSYFNIDGLMQTCSGPNPAKPEMIMYLTLIFWVLVYIPKLNLFRQYILEKYNKHLSPNKFASFMLDNLKKYFLDGKAVEQLLVMLVHYCCYDKRKDRINNSEKLYITIT